jgi:hypothetical protein
MNNHLDRHMEFMKLSQMDEWTQNQRHSKRSVAFGLGRAAINGRGRTLPQNNWQTGGSNGLPGTGEAPLFDLMNPVVGRCWQNGGVGLKHLGWPGISLNRRGWVWLFFHQIPLCWCGRTPQKQK